MMNRVFLTTIGAFLMTSAFACGGRDTIVNARNGVVVRVLHPASIVYRCQTRSQGDRTSAEVSWGEGVIGQRVKFEVNGSRLSVNGLGYGTVAKGDKVTIDGDTISVNGRSRDSEKRGPDVRAAQP